MEDAKATGDLVRVKVRETWKSLKRQEWRIEAGNLIEPGMKGQKEKEVVPSSLGMKEYGKLAGSGVLGPGAGVKRRSPSDDK
jgi:hypothetical protein